MHLKGILGPLIAVACLAGCAMGERCAPPSRTASSSSGITPQRAKATAAQPRLGAISWPASGTSAADISGFGEVDGPGATQPVPIASVAKLMTAYVILRDHPLPEHGMGPIITVRPSEADAYSDEARNGDSLVAVSSGEKISERHALEALLLPSADNMAWILARWDAGSEDAFVTKMNAAARAMGMTGTTYTDSSGLYSSTTSTAADQVRLGTAAMRVPVLAAIAGMPRAYIPVAGEISNTNKMLGTDGIAGLKTGSTRAAGGCLLAAAWHEVNGRKLLIVAAAFGQPGTDATILPNALRAGDNLVVSLDHALDAGSRPGTRSSSGNDSRDLPRPKDRP